MATSSSGSSGHLPALVGREREQRLLRTLLDDAIGGHGRVVLVSGEAGIGKTALVQSLVRDALEQDILVLTGHCYDLTTTPPYGLWLDLTDRYSVDGDLPELPEVLKRGTGAGDLPSQLAVYQVGRDFFQSIAKRRPFVLVLEDLHWVDQASLEFLRFIARQIHDHRILLIVTYRDDEVTRRHPLFQFVPMLVREAAAERIELRNLHEASVRALVADRYSLSRRDQDRLVTYLQAHAEGHPLFLQELLRTLEEEQLLRRNGDGWVLGKFSRVPVPRLIQQVIEGRIARLNEETQRLLRLAAVIGPEVSLDLLQRVSEVDYEVLLNAVEESVEAHLLEESRDVGRMRFGHALIRETLYVSAPIWRRRNWHRRIADALIASANPEPDAVAYHLQESGDPRAIEWLVRSGELAQRNYAWVASADRFEAAQALLEGFDSRALERGWLLFRAGRMRRFTDSARAHTLLTLAESIASSTNDAVLTAYARFDLGHLQILIGDLHKGLAEMEAAVSLLESLPPDHARENSAIARWIADSLPPAEYGMSEENDRDEQAVAVNLRLGVLIFWLAIDGRIAETLESGQRYVAQATAIARPSAVLRGSIGDAYCGLGIALALAGRPEEARQSFADATTYHRSIHHHRMVTSNAWHELASVQLPYHTDAIEERWRLVREVEAAWEMSEYLGAWSSVDTDLQAARIPLLHLEAEWSEARQRGRRVLESIAGTGLLRSYQSSLNLTTLGMLARQQGELAEAWSQVHKLLLDGPETRPGDYYYEVAVATQQLAISLALDEGDSERARIWLNAHDRWLDWSGAVLGQAERALLWARYSVLVGDYLAARAYAEQALQHAAEPRQPLALVAVHRFLGELDAEARHFSDAGPHLHESLALAEACGAPFERALTMLASAELEVQKGNAEAAQGLLTEVHRICSELGARPTLERAEKLMTRVGIHHAEAHFGLTARELDVLRLLVQGLSDKEIADELFISHHTVMRHVSHILAKLDVESRVAAAAFAVRNGLA